MNIRHWQEDKLLRKQQLAQYTQFLPNVGSILDIGCGSGLMLEVLNDHGFSAQGIDLDSEKVADCTQKQLDALKADALRFLKSISNEYAGIVCSHIVEHLWPGEVIKLFELSYQRLQKNGILIILTPNPSNLHIITNTFWLDASHKRPYPNELLKKMLISTGFSIIKSGEDRFYLPNSRFRRILLNAKRLILGRALFDLNYSSGEIFVVAKKEAQGNA